MPIRTCIGGLVFGCGWEGGGGVELNVACGGYEEAHEGIIANKYESWR